MKGKIFDFSEVKNGDIIRLKNDPQRDWVCIHYSKCDMSHRERHNDNIPNHTGFYLFSGLWYEGDPQTGDPYGKCIEHLEVGMRDNIERIVGSVLNKVDLELFKDYGKITIL